MTTLSAGWGALAVPLLVLLAALAAALDGALSARADGSATLHGFTKPLRESARLLRQRRRTTVAADSLLWRAGAAGLLVVAVLKVVVVPLGEWTVLDLDVGVMWFNALDVMVWPLVWLTGWGANSVYGLIGGYRFLAHGLAYELPLMFALLGPAIAAESLDVGVIAGAQDGVWFAVWMPVAFVGYVVGVLAFSLWGPFAPAIGADVAGGAAAELSSIDRLLFQGGRYALLVAGAAFAVPLFLGGGAGPLLPAWLWTLVKTLVLLGVLVWLRRRLPAARPDLFMEIGWLVLLPAVLAQDLLVALLMIWRQ